MTLTKILEQILALLKVKTGPSKGGEGSAEIECLSRRIKVLEDERSEALALAKELREVVDKWES